MPGRAMDHHRGSPADLETAMTPLIGADSAQGAWDRVVRALRGLESLRADWDGQGADAPVPGLVRGAVELAEQFARRDFPPPVTATPTPAGSILLGWRWGRDYLEIEVVGPDRIDWMFVDGSGATEHGEDLASLLRRWVDLAGRIGGEGG